MKFGSCVALLWLSAVAPLALAADQPVVFDRVHVVPMDAEHVLRDQRVVVADGRIRAVGDADAVAIPDGYRVVDGNGAYLLPGLAEMHAHVPPDPDDRDYAERVLFLYLANGITTARSMLGHEWHLELQWALERHEVTGPRVIASGPSFSGGSVESPDHARRMVAEQVELGFDFLKVHPGMTREQFDAMAEAAGEAGIPFAGHVPSDVGLERALQAGIASVDHLDGYVTALAVDVPDGTSEGLFGHGLVRWVDEDRIPELVRATREAGAWVVPTETLLVNLLAEEPTEELAARPQMRYMPAEVVDGWAEGHRNFAAVREDGHGARHLELRARLLRELHQGGVGVLLGADAPQIFNVPGFSIHREMRLMEEAGMSPYEVLVSGTANPARYFGHEGRYGRVAPGLEADLILVDGNPLEDLGVLERPLGVMARGLWLDRDALDERLDELRSR